MTTTHLRAGIFHVFSRLIVVQRPLPARQSAVVKAKEGRGPDYE